MIRALSTACLVLAFALGGGRAWAGKPTIAILGLEVSDNGGGMDQASATLARDLTDGLRTRAKAGTGQYNLAPGSDKELVDQKLLKNCDSEKADCMAAICNDLGADYLMYGKLEKTAKHDYQISIKLLKCSSKALQTSMTDTIAATQTGGQALQSTAKAAYAKLTGESSGGSVVVRVTNPTIDRASVLINEEQKGFLSSGTATIAGLPEGKYDLAIEAKGFQRYEAKITVRNGEVTSHAATLVDLPVKPTGGPDELSHEVGGTISQPEGNGWQKVAITSGIATAVLGATFTVSWLDLRSTGPERDAMGNLTGNVFKYGGDCKTLPGTTQLDPSEGRFGCKNGELLTVTTYVTGITAVAAAGLTLVALYKSSRASSGSEHASSTDRGHRKPKPQFAITPVVSPQGGGATFRIDW